MTILVVVMVMLSLVRLPGAEFKVVPQRFVQEVAVRWPAEAQGPQGGVQLIDWTASGGLQAMVDGQWYRRGPNGWQITAEAGNRTDSAFAFLGSEGRRVELPVPWRSVVQLLRRGGQTWVVTSQGIWPGSGAVAEKVLSFDQGIIRQAALSSSGVWQVASTTGVYRRTATGWESVAIRDGLGRAWAVEDVRGVAFDATGALWVACRAGVAMSQEGTWTFFEGKDGLPYNDFTGIFPGPAGQIWFGTRLGAICYHSGEWNYRQGGAWLPNDEVRQVALDESGNAWFATAAGVGGIERRSMSLREKAELYETEIERHIKRTPFGYVAEASLAKAGDKSSARSWDSDNDGLWTSMYGAGECFGYAATRDPALKTRAKKAFEALRFLQKVTQGGDHAPPAGYIARTIRPIELPDPNEGRLASDRREQQKDRLWKSYEPRWPKSADGKWYWKSDTSSDELDGHYFFYPLYYEFCADEPAERERVRDVVRGITDHLLTHRFLLMDHDGKPTRWGIYGPEYLNQDPMWWPERGLNSLSILAYLTVAHYVTGDAKYAQSVQELMDRYGYAHNAMYPKVQHGPGSGNQSDDEMAFMSYYVLLRYSQNETLSKMMRYSFFRYWANEAPEMNPFFNYAYAAHGIGQKSSNPFGTFDITPWKGWDTDSQASLYGFPLDRIAWGHKNSHRLDIVGLPPQRSRDLYAPDRRDRGQRSNGKVLPVENRHFNHWNTDPWTLDYGGDGRELASGTVFLLPYYLGMYHGFVEKP